MLRITVLSPWTSVICFHKRLKIISEYFFNHLTGCDELDFMNGINNII